MAKQAGYSGTPLAKKLGIQPNRRVLLLEAPASVRDTLAPVLAETDWFTNLRGTRPFDLIAWFTRSKAELEARFGTLAVRLEPTGGLWIAWPKQASKVVTDITEDVVRRVALTEGLVDNKVCAVDEIWSGLRCVIRRENRGLR